VRDSTPVSGGAAAFDVFDCHHHVGEASAFQADVGMEGGTRGDSELEGRLAIMDRGGVRQAAVIPGHGYERPHGIADTRRENDGIAAYRDRRPDRFPVAIGIVEPLHGAAAQSELARCARELGLRGISLHGRFQGVSMDDLRVERCVARMGELGLVPLLHALAEAAEESLWKIAKLARAFPELPMLVLDAFAGFESTKECFEVAERCPKLLFDTSLSYNFDFLELFARRFGAERVVFGTDLYSPPLGRRISHLLPQIVESSLAPAEKALILGGNARRLFGVAC
jgi:hypothetical protein